MKKYEKIETISLFTLVVIVMVIALVAYGKNENSDHSTTELATTVIGAVTDTVSTSEENQELNKKEGIIQPSENPEDYFSGKVKITTFVEPDENGYYVVEESQWTLDINRKTLDEEVEHRKGEFEKLGVEVIETSTATDGSAGFVFDEENYRKMVTVIENITNNRVGLYGNCVSISRDFKEVILYVDESTKLINVCARVSYLSWTVFECQAYSGEKASDVKILVKIAHIDTEEILMELTLDMNTSFSISEEEWAALFEK